ncbi:MAG: PQQ-like beta-propeller repeat protein, partial [Planctomycetes bacterium]|nr:PQQ-like beta-propeller repeat protein [Planctomycetota bacterium]
RIGDKASLFCLNAETGKQLWEFSYPTGYVDLYGYNSGPRASPIVDGNRVYIFGVEGMLHCLRASDGKLVWKFDTAKQFGVVQNFFGAGSTPVIDGNLLIAMVGGSPKDAQELPPGRLDLVEGNGSGVVAFNKFSGKVKYKITDELASYASPKLATINNRRWCFMFARGGLVGFNPSSGKVDFQYPWRARVLESVNASTPVVVGNQVFISETYGPGSSLLEVAPGKSRVVWMDGPRKREKSFQMHWNTAIYHKGFLYGCSGRNPPDADLRCVEWKSGKVKWKVENKIRTSLLYVDGHFVCLGEFGKLQLFRPNPNKFDLVAEVTLKQTMPAPQPLGVEPPNLLQYPCWSAPIISHGLLYIRGKDRLVCLELIPEKRR